MSNDSLPEVDLSLLSGKLYPVVPKLLDVSNDYGAPNLLFLYDTPYIPDDKRQDLETIRYDIQSWNAWELATAENQVQIQLSKKNLPDDDSIESRVKRSEYRAKVISVLREEYENGWLLRARSAIPKSFSKDIKKTSANAWVREVLQGHYIDTAVPKRAPVILSIISNILASNPYYGHKYYISSVYYNYDNDLKIIRPYIEVSSFTVTQSPKEGAEDMIILNAESLDFAFTLDKQGWEDARSKVEDIVKEGEKIRQEMALDLYHAE
ncbi:hypothetical protein F4805DRAFT_473570 [Annulohypoxylon moriforme]|nr:hypothetical protein F4805DRAFT_473570 [Annulohypoxylon moriforme]